MKITISYSLRGKEMEMNEEFSFDIPNQTTSKPFLTKWKELISSLHTMQSSSLDGLNVSGLDWSRHFPFVHNWQNMYSVPTDEGDSLSKSVSDEENSEEKSQ